MSKKDRTKAQQTLEAPQPPVAAVAPQAIVSAPAVPVSSPQVAKAAERATAVAIAVAPTPEASRDRSTIVALIGRLRDREADIARDAAATLGRLPSDAQAVDALCAVVRNADAFFHPVVRAAAAHALGALRDPRALDALIQATRDTMAEASEEAVKALGLLQDKRALPALEAVIRNETGFFLDNVRRTAQESVVRIKAAPAKV